MTLQQLSDLCGLSISFLSQAERDLASPTVNSLANIAHALGVSASYFFPPPPCEDLVVRSYERHPFRLEEGKAVYAKLGGDFAKRSLEPLIATYPPHFKSERGSHDGEEFLCILEGQLVIFLDNHVYALNANDSIHYSSRHLHGVENRHNTPCQVIFVNTPRYLD